MNTLSDEPVWSLSRVRAEIARMPQISEAERSAYNRACAIVAKLWDANVKQKIARYGACDASLSFDCQTLNSFLFRHPAQSVGLAESSFANFLSDLRKVLRALGLHHADDRGHAIASSDWVALHNRLPTRERRLSLIGFFRFCDRTNVDSASADTATLMSFERHLRERTLCDDVGGKSRVAASNWNWAAQNLSGWPQQRLVRPRMRDEYTTPIDHYCPTLVREIDGFLADLSGSVKPDIPSLKIFSLDANRRVVAPHLAPATIEGKRWLLRLILGALVRAGYPIEAFNSLKDIVYPIERPLAAMEFLGQRHLQRARESTGRETFDRAPQSGQLAQVAELMRQIAKHRCRLPDDYTEQFQRWRRQVSPKQGACMTDRNAASLRSLMAEDACRSLLNLPGQWLKDASQAPERSQSVACKAMYAAALEVLTACPIRRTDLLNIRIGIELQRDNNGHFSFLVIRVSKAKRRNLTIEFPLPADTAERLKTYINLYRPILADGNNSYLFSGRDGPREASHFATQLSARVRRALGTEFNMHVMRHFAVWRHLTKYPNEMEIMRQVLGHASIETTRKFYAGLESIAALKHFGKVLEADRESRNYDAQSVLRSRRRAA